MTPQRDNKVTVSKPGRLPEVGLGVVLTSVESLDREHPFATGPIENVYEDSCFG